MSDRSLNSFTYIVLCYNHEKFIIEHLESIKYLISEYGHNWESHIIINDDFSKDSTRELIKKWLKINENIFTSISLIFNNKNIGTCKSVINCLKLVKTDFLKLTAGDDVYSFEDIYTLASMTSEKYPIVSGMPLELLENEIRINKNTIFEILATHSIFSSLPLISRFKFATNNNAPNIIYLKDALIDDYLLKNLDKYDVVEDWPICISIAELYPNSEFQLINKIFVYYRRTLNSTYLVANNRFTIDQLKIFNYLINRETNFTIKLMLINRKVLFRLNKPYLKKIMNLSNFYFLSKSLLNIKDIWSQINNSDLRLVEHQKHYKDIKLKADEFIETYRNFSFN